MAGSGPLADSVHFAVFSKKRIALRGPLYPSAFLFCKSLCRTALPPYGTAPARSGAAKPLLPAPCLAPVPLQIGENVKKTDTSPVL